MIVRVLIRGVEKLVLGYVVNGWSLMPYNSERLIWAGTIGKKSEEVK